MDLSLLPSLAQHYSSIFSTANSSSSSSSGYYHHHHHHHHQHQQQPQHQTPPTSSTSTYPSVVVGHPGLNDSGYYHHHNHGTSMQAINPQTFYPYHHTISNNSKTSSSYYEEIVGGGGGYIINNGEINNFVRDSNSETSETSNFEPPLVPPLAQHPLPSSSYCYLEKQPFSDADGSPNAQTTKWSAFDESAQNLKQQQQQQSSQPHPLLLLTHDTQHTNPLMDDYYQHSSENKEVEEEEEEEEDAEELDGSSSYEKNSLKSATIPNPNRKSMAGINGGRMITQEDENYITITTTTANGVVRVVKRRSANKKERRRTQSINSAFSNLRDCIPNVPADTKLSKIKTLRLATSYISYLMKLLDEPGENGHKLLTEGFRADLSNAKRSTQQNRIETQNEIQRQLRLQQYKQLQQQQQQSLIVPRRHNSNHHHHHHHHHHHQNHDNHQHKFSEKSNKSAKTNHANESATIGHRLTEQQPFDLSLEKTNHHQCLTMQQNQTMMITETADAPVKPNNGNPDVLPETSTPPSSPPSTMAAIHSELPSVPNLRPRCRTGWPQHVWALELKNYDQ